MFGVCASTWTVGDVMALMESWYPAATAQSWDRVGLIVGDPAAPVRSILLALDPTAAIADQAVAGPSGDGQSFDMVITHHPLLLHGASFLPVTDPKGGVSAAVAEAERIASERPGAIIASQFTNPANPAAHVAHTGEEIWADTDGQVDVFVAGVGTGGTISGVAKVLKGKNPNVRVIAVQPAESPLLTGGNPGPHGIQGLMPNFVPETFDSSVVDEVISVETASALEFARRAAAEEGLLVGISSGAALAGVAAVAARPEFAGKKIVTLLPDTGERYLSTALFAGLED